MVKLAGLKPRPKPFHGMRASRETDLLEQHPLQAVARWMGHSPKIAVANYLRVRDARFDRAAAKGQTDLAHFPAHSSPKGANQRSSRVSTTSEKKGLTMIDQRRKIEKRMGRDSNPRYSFP